MRIVALSGNAGTINTRNQKRKFVKWFNNMFHKLKSRPYILLFMLMAVYIIVVSYVSFLGHETFKTNAWDLGIYSQSLWTTLKDGTFFYSTPALPGNPSGSFFGIHFSPFLFFLLPIYSLLPDPITLLVLRSIALSAGLIPLYWLVREELKNQIFVLVFAIVYLFYPPTLVPLNNFDLEAFLPALFLFSLYYLKHEKLFRAYFFIILALMVNEFVPLIVVAMAVYYFLLHRKEIFNGLWSRKITKNAIFSITL
jgi:uncharacterized membrane protein